MRGVQGRGGRGPGHPVLAGGIPAYGSRLEIDDL